MEEYQADGYDCVCSDIFDLVTCRVGMWIAWYCPLDETNEQDGQGVTDG